MKYLLHHGLEDSAQKYPDKDAMRYMQSALTYTELSDRSTQLAHFLVGQGVGRRDRVGIFLNKSLESIIAIYGIMKAGGVYVPLDPRSPVSRLEKICHDCDIKGIISQEDKYKVLAEVDRLNTPLEFVIGVSLRTEDNLSLRLFSWHDVAQMQSEKLPSVTLVEHDLAYVMYTSGSTGKPKGIMHTHYSGLSYVRASADIYGVTHEDVLGNNAPLHFDQSTFEYLTGPYVGATTVIIPETYMMFPANLSKLIQDERMTIWYSVPFALIQLIKRGVLEQRDLSALRWIQYGGEPFPRGHMRSLLTYLPTVRVSNVYGPTEVNQCTYYHIPPLATWDDDDEAQFPIGGMIDNAEGLIVDENDDVVPDGEMGELLVRTPTMMRGYWGRPDLSERAFYQRQIAPDLYDTFFRTGDLVKMRPDGLMDFFGRKDYQVKVRGFRVELAEIDLAASSHPAVEEACAYVVDSVAGNVVEVAIIMVEGQSASASDIIGHVAKRVPHYAVPERIIIKEAFPRTGTDKTDRKALQEMAMDV